MNDGIKTYYKLPFRKCSVKDFEKRGYLIDPDETKAYEKRLCPDVAFGKDIVYKIMNGYSNRKKRINFSIDIFKCKEKEFFGNTCKNDTEIETFLREVYFTFYTLTSRVSYDQYSKTKG